MHINLKKKNCLFGKYLIDFVVIIYISLISFIISIFQFKKNCSDIVILRLDALGDLFLWLSSASEIRKKHEKKHITLICRHEYEAFLKSFHMFDSLIPINLNMFFSSPKYHVKMINKIRMHKYKLLLCPMFSRAIKSDVIAKLINADKKIGYLGDKSSIRKLTRLITNKWYTELVINKFSNDVKHEINNNYNFLKHIGIHEKPKIFSPPLKASPKLNLPSKYYVLFPGSSNKYRNWSIKYFSEVIKFINLSYKIIPVLCGGSSEIEISKELINLNKSINFISIVNETSISDLIDVIARAKFVLTNETAATHISASVNTLCFTILGGGHFGRFAPYDDFLDRINNNVIFKKLECFNCNWKCTKITDQENTYPCINNIKPLDVIKKIKSGFNVKF